MGPDGTGHDPEGQIERTPGRSAWRDELFEEVAGSGISLRKGHPSPFPSSLPLDEKHHPQGEGRGKGAAYPKKQVKTWTVSQLLCKAGTRGWILLLDTRDDRGIGHHQKGDGHQKSSEAPVPRPPLDQKIEEEDRPGEKRSAIRRSSRAEHGRSRGRRRSSSAEPGPRSAAKNRPGRPRRRSCPKTPLPEPSGPDRRERKRDRQR